MKPAIVAASLSWVCPINATWRLKQSLLREKGRCTGSVMSREQEREKQKSLRRRERKWEKEETCGPSNGNKLGPTWIQSGFEFGLDSKTGERLNSNLAWDSHKIQVGISILTQKSCTKQVFFVWDPVILYLNHRIRIWIRCTKHALYICLSDCNWSIVL